MAICKLYANDLFRKLLIPRTLTCEQCLSHIKALFSEAFRHFRPPVMGDTACGRMLVTLAVEDMYLILFWAGLASLLCAELLIE